MKSKLGFQLYQMRSYWVSPPPTIFFFFLNLSFGSRFYQSPFGVYLFLNRHSRRSVVVRVSAAWTWSHISNATKLKKYDFSDFLSAYFSQKPWDQIQLQMFLFYFMWTIEALKSIPYIRYKVVQTSMLNEKCSLHMP